MDAATTANLGSVLRLYRRSLPHSWVPSLLLALVWGVWSAAMSRRLGAPDDPLQWIAQLQLLLSSAAFWRLSIAAACLSVLPFSAMLANIHAVATGATVPAIAGLVKAVRIFPVALACALIFMALTSIATVLFVIPGAYLWGMWQLWPVALVVEQTGPLAALNRSWQLVAGSWWRVTTLVSIVSLVAVVPTLIIDALLGPALGGIGLNAAHSQTLMTAVDGVLEVLLTPIIPSALVAIFLDLSRKPRLAGPSAFGAG